MKNNCDELLRFLWIARNGAAPRSNCCRVQDSWSASPRVCSGFGIAPETPLRDYREWIDRVLSLRDRHLGARWGSKRVVTSLLPVLAIGQGASAFSGEYTLEEFSSRLREAVGLL